MGTWHLFRDLHAVPCGRQRIKWDRRQVEMKLDEVARATLPVEGPAGHAEDFAVMPVLYGDPWGSRQGTVVMTFVFLEDDCAAAERMKPQK